MRFMGIDPSLSATGICLPTGETTRWVPPKGFVGDQRLAWFEHQMLTATVNPMTIPNLVILEGYAYGRANQAHQLGELGGIIRLTLRKAFVPYVVVPPSTLKKYATGKGNASKEEVLVQAVLRRGVEMTNDEADSWWLWQIGLAYAIEIAGKYETLPGYVYVDRALKAGLDKLDWPGTIAMTYGPSAADAFSRGDECRNPVDHTKDAS